jgi:hypothetical protein
MPASLPGDTETINTTGNPNAGRLVTFDLLSGPKGSPFDRDQTARASTGGLSTGIGFGASGVPSVIGPTAPASIVAAGFQDDYTPGLTKPDGTASANSTIMHIGGGRMIANVDAVDKIARPFVPSPYTAGWGIGAAGNGGSRDAGAGPAFTGFRMKMVTATGAVASGAAVETGFINRSGVAMISGESVFASASAAAAVPALALFRLGDENARDPELPWIDRQRGDEPIREGAFIDAAPARVPVEPDPSYDPGYQDPDRPKDLNPNIPGRDLYRDPETTETDQDREQRRERDEQGKEEPFKREEPLKPELPPGAR